MIDVKIHFRGETSEQRSLAVLPVVGSYLHYADRLWRVDAVTFDGDGVDVFALEVSPRLAGELQAAWSGWGHTSQIQEAQQ
jgi:hypothetical protein